MLLLAGLLKIFLFFLLLLIVVKRISFLLKLRSICHGKSSFPLALGSAGSLSIEELVSLSYPGALDSVDSFSMEISVKFSHDEALVGDVGCVQVFSLGALGFVNSLSTAILVLIAFPRALDFEGPLSLEDSPRLSCLGKL